MLYIAAQMRLLKSWANLLHATKQQHFSGRCKFYELPEGYSLGFTTLPNVLQGDLLSEAFARVSERGSAGVPLDFPRVSQ